MSFGHAVRTCLTQYATFHGRARRSEFWWFYLFVSIVVSIPVLLGTILLVTGLATAATSSPTTSASGLNALAIVGIVILAIGLLISLATLVPTLAVGARRLHDGGYSAWLLLLWVISPANIVLIVFWALPGTQAPNQYGAVPG